MDNEVKKDSIKLSVIVPVYNVEPYLKRCLDSLIYQTYKNLEIILVDDGSTDRSGDICDDYAKHDARIFVIHKENGGLVSARKAGIRQATGEYSISVDSDDWIENNAYEKIVEKLRIFKPDMLVFGLKKEGEGFIEEYKPGLEEGFYESEELWRTINYCVSKETFYHQPIDMPLWNKGIKTDILKKYQFSCPDSIKKNEDDAVIFPCLLNIQSLYCHVGTYYHYCVRKNSIMWEENENDYEMLKVTANHLITSYCRCKNRTRISVENLLYKLFYQILIEFPEKLWIEGKCLFYPKIDRESRIIVYGKGVFANRFICRIKELNYCSIVANIDGTDAEKIYMMDEKQYDYVVIAVTNSLIVEKAIDRLKKLKVNAEKVLYIHKEDITWETLPDEIRNMYKE